MSRAQPRISKLPKSKSTNVTHTHTHNLLCTKKNTPAHTNTPYEYTLHTYYTYKYKFTAVMLAHLVMSLSLSLYNSKTYKRTDQNPVVNRFLTTLLSTQGNKETSFPTNTTFPVSLLFSSLSSLSPKL